MKPKDMGRVEIEEIMGFLPHKYPFLFIDRVLEIEPDKSIVCVKNVTVNEPFFQGHFPGRPIVPGVILLESMAQAGGVLVLFSHAKEFARRNFFFLGADKVRFRKVVRPGDQLKIEARVLRHRETVWKFQCKCQVEDQVVAEAVLMAMVQ
jgi:beta-hydroxyacyl-ACP dehydratase FabZ